MKLAAAHPKISVQVSHATVGPRLSLRVFFGLVVLSLLSTGVASNEFLYPSVDAQALLFRSVILLALPFYLHLVMSDPSLRPSLRNPLTVAVLGFLAASLVSTVLGVNPLRSFWGYYARMGGTFHLLHLTLLYFYVLLLAKVNRAYPTALLQTLVFIAAGASVYAILTALGMRPWFPDGSWPDRISSIYGNPIFFASCLIFPMSFALFFACRAKTNPSRVLYVALVGLLGIGVGLSGSRGAVLAIAAALFVGGILFAFQSRKRSYRYVAVSLFLLLGLGVFLLPRVAPRFPQITRVARMAHFTDEYRLALWSIGWQGYKERPFLGTGPENYDVVFHQHFDQHLFAFDATKALSSVLYDKPHNFPLELLVTTGTLGGIAYLAMFVATVLALHGARRANLISCPQFVVLVSGAVAYQVEDFFSFDTPAVSVVAYVFAGFAGAMWKELQPQGRLGIAQRTSLPTWGRVGLGMAACASILGVIVTDGITAVTIRDINYGAAIGNIDVRAGKRYFDSAAKSSFIFDRRELLQEYEALVGRLVAREHDGALVNSALDGAIAVAEKANSEMANDAVLWIRLADLYLLKAVHTDVPPAPATGIAIRNAMALAPGRLEPLEYLAVYELDSNRDGEAGATCNRLIAVAPERQKARWVQALLARRQSQQDSAAETALAALRAGYKVSAGKELAWLIDYYTEKRDYVKTAEVYEKAVQVDPSDSRLYAGLAKTYESLGQQAKASSAWSHWQLNTYAERHAYRELAQVYERAIPSNPDDGRLYSVLATVYAQLGEKEKARVAAKRAVQLVPSLDFQTKAFLRSLD